MRFELVPSIFLSRLTVHGSKAPVHSEAIYAVSSGNEKEKQGGLTETGHFPYLSPTASLIYPLLLLWLQHKLCQE